MAGKYRLAPMLLLYSEVGRMDKWVSAHLSTSLLGLSPLSITTTCIMFDGCRRLFMSTQKPPPNNPGLCTINHGVLAHTHTCTNASILHSVCIRSHTTVSSDSHTFYYMQTQKKKTKKKGFYLKFQLKDYCTIKSARGGGAAVIFKHSVRSQSH